MDVWFDAPVGVTSASTERGESPGKGHWDWQVSSRQSWPAMVERIVGHKHQLCGVQSAKHREENVREPIGTLRSTAAGGCAARCRVYCLCLIVRAEPKGWE